MRLGGGAAAGPGLATVEAYDPATDTWTKKADMPTARQFLSTSAVNGKIYAFGGQRGPGGADLSTVEEYDPATDSWTKKADMPLSSAAPSTSVVNGIIYVIGGLTPLPALQAYDPATDTWTKKADMPTPRACLSASAVNGKIYAIGGGSDWAVALKKGTVEEYDTGFRERGVEPTGKLATTWGEIKR